MPILSAYTHLGMDLLTFRRNEPLGLLVSTCAAALLTLALAPFRHEVGLLNEGLLFLLLTLLVAGLWGWRVGVYTAVVTNLALNFFFIEPVHRFAVQEVRNIASLAIFLAVSVIGGALLASATQAAAIARRRQLETEIALRLSRGLSEQTEPQEALRVLCEEVVHSFAAPGAAVLTRGAGDEWQVVAHAGGADARRVSASEERTALERASSQGSFEGLGSTGLSSARKARIIVPRGREAAFRLDRSVAFVPLKLGERVVGVLRVDGPIGDTPFRAEPERLLAAVASEAAIALQRVELAREAAHAQALREADELKNALLNAVSHDLRTPLASIIASAGSLQQTDVNWTEEDRLAFAEAIEQEGQRLNRLVGNLLDLSRIDSGSLQPAKGWYDLSALVDDVVGRLKPLTTDNKVCVFIPEGLPPISLDYIEIDEVLTNLIENAAKYALAGTPIEVTAELQDSQVVVSVSDQGPGIPVEALERIFEPFYRVKGAAAGGTGLGLAVAKGLVEAHGGRIWAENRPGGGAKISFTLPVAPVAHDAALERQGLLS